MAAQPGRLVRLSCLRSAGKTASGLGEAAKELAARTTASCRKSENLVAFSYTESVLPHARSRAPLPGALSTGKREREETFAEKPAQPIEKVRFGRENPRKSKIIQRSQTGVFAAKRAQAKKTQRLDREGPFGGKPPGLSPFDLTKLKIDIKICLCLMNDVRPHSPSALC
jgi:hypothetical protein